MVYLLTMFILYLLIINHLDYVLLLNTIGLLCSIMFYIYIHKYLNKVLLSIEIMDKLVEGDVNNYV